MVKSGGISLPPPSRCRYTPLCRSRCEHRSRFGAFPSPRPVFQVETSLRVILVLEKPEMHEKGTSNMSTRTSTMSTRLLSKDALLKLKMIGYWVTTIIVTLELLAGGVTDLIHGQHCSLPAILSSLSWHSLATRCTCSQSWACGSCWEPSPCLCRGFLGSRNGRMPAPSLSMWVRLRLGRRAVVAWAISSCPSSSPCSRSLRGRFDRQAGPSASSFLGGVQA